MKEVFWGRIKWFQSIWTQWSNVYNSLKWYAMHHWLFGVTLSYIYMYLVIRVLYIFLCTVYAPSMHMSQIRKLNHVHSESYMLKIIVENLVGFCSIYARSMLGLCSVYDRFMLLALHKPYRKTFLASMARPRQSTVPAHQRDGSGRLQHLGSRHGMHPPVRPWTSRK